MALEKDQKENWSPSERVNSDSVSVGFFIPLDLAGVITEKAKEKGIPFGEMAREFLKLGLEASRREKNA